MSIVLKSCLGTMVRYFCATVLSYNLTDTTMSAQYMTKTKNLPQFSFLKMSNSSWRSQGSLYMRYDIWLPTIF